MEIGVVVLVAAAALAILVARRTTGGPSRVISGMWRYHGPGWPSGVQEDDEAHWSWANAHPRPTADADEATDDRPDPADHGLTVDIAPIGYEVRSAADRARS